MISIRILFFAQTAKLVGQDEAQLSIAAGLNLGAVKQEIFVNFPQLSDISASLLWAVDEEMVDDSFTLEEGQLVAVMPPFSGG